MFTAVNSLRGALGVGLLAQDPVLDAAAGYHAQYEADNQVVMHDETSGESGYNGATPLSRALWRTDDRMGWRSCGRNLRDACPDCRNRLL